MRDRARDAKGQYVPSPAFDRIMEHIRVTPQGCWEWQGYRTRQGYGHLCLAGYHGRMVFAHRVVWEQRHGPVPAGKILMHECDNPPCVNPKHLRLGTHLENRRDAIQKGRPRNTARGERHGRARLRPNQVSEIRRLRAQGVKLKTLAARFGMSESSISGIALNQSWRHLWPAEGLGWGPQ